MECGPSVLFSAWDREASYEVGEAMRFASKRSEIRMVAVLSVAAIITSSGGNTAAGGQTSAPPNDACANAIVAATANFVHSTNTALAITAPSDPTPPCGDGSRRRSVWYRYTASNDGALSVDTHDSGYDTILSAYTGACASLAPVPGACNDDDPSEGAQSRIDFVISRGETYFFMVSAHRSSGDPLIFRLRFLDATPRPTATASRRPSATPTPSRPPTATPAPPACQGDCDSSGGVTVDEIVTGISIALGDLEVESCDVLDPDGNGSVTVDELLQAIQRALDGC